MADLIYLIAVTADGFIADPDGDASFFGNDPQTLAAVFEEYPETCPTHLREVLGVHAPARHFGSVIMGRRTHQPALDAGLTSAYPHLDQYVVTGRDDLPADDRVTVVDDPVGVVRDLKRRSNADIWLCGGGHLAGQLVDEIDQYHFKINPVLIGSGTPVIATDAAPRPLTLQSTRTLPAGVQLAVYTPAARS